MDRCFEEKGKDDIEFWKEKCFSDFIVYEHDFDPYLKKKYSIIYEDKKP